MFNSDSKLNSSLTEVNTRSEKVKQILISQYR